MAPNDDNTRKLLAAGLGGLSVALALAAAFAMFERPAGASPAPREDRGGPLPGFELPRLQGGSVRLEELGGKVVVVDFWATWCPPCRAEMPWLVKLAKRVESRGVAFVAIAEDDPPGQIPLVTEFSRQVPGLERFAVLGDPEVESRFGVTSLPTLFITDRQGRLVARLTGAAEEAAVVGLVERLAAE